MRIFDADVTGSLQVSGSSNFKGGVTVSGSQTVTGSLTVHGNAKVGDQITDTHTVTGSLNVTGSISGSLTGVLRTDYIDFNTGSTVTGQVARMTWNDTDGTVDIGMKGGNVTLQVGQEQLVRVVNGAGQDLLEQNYQAVRIDGVQGNRIKVNLAQADTNINSDETLGIVTETILDNNEGFVTVGGLVRGINTTGAIQGELWSGGDILYLSPINPGQITNVKPQAPQHLLIIGYVVRAHATQGSIFVKVSNGYDIDELHNVNIKTGSLSYGDLLMRSGSVWSNSKVLSGSYALTGSLDISGSQTINGNQIISGSITITQNISVLGTSSFVYVTSSNLNLTGPFIYTNVFEPIERFGGLVVFDSGSSNATASLLWDSLNNHWIYQNASGSMYSGGMLLSGPRNTGSLGDELGLTSTRIPKSVGGDHLDNSNIYDTGTVVKIISNSEITGSLKVTGGISGSIDYSYIQNVPSLVSGSAQINITGTTGYSAVSSSIATALNGSWRLTDGTTSEDINFNETVTLQEGGNMNITLMPGTNTVIFDSLHQTISAASSSNNSGRTYIQDILLDVFGHITGITTATETVVDTHTTGVTFNTGDGVLTFTKNNGSTYTVDLDGRYGTSSTDYYVTGGTFNTSTGNLRLTRNDGGTIDVDLDGRYLESHPAVSAASSSDNSGRTYIQDILLDSFGHITGITTATETVVDTNNYTTGATTNGTTGLITFTRNDGGTYTTSISGYVTTQISNLIDSAPSTLDTLNELAAALGDDPNFATSVATAIGNKVSKSGDTMTGDLSIFKNDSKLTLGQINVSTGYASIEMYAGNGGTFNGYTIRYNKDTSFDRLEFVDGSGNPRIYFENGGILNASTIVKIGGTSSQFLKADGSVDSNTYLTAHPSVSAASSSNNSGRTYIQDILLDSFGHITGITTASETVTDTFTTGATFNTGNGVITFTNNNGGGTFTVDIDGRFLTSYTEVDTLEDVVSRNGITTQPITAASFIVTGANSSQFLKGDGTLDSNTYLTAHPSVSAASSSNNSGRTYIQDILLDSFGHITGITTATETVVDTNTFITGATFNTSDGVVTITKNDGNTVTVDLDGRYQLSGSYLTGYTETDTLATVTARGASTATPVTFNSDVTLGNAADLKFVDLAGTFPTSGKGFDWTLNNDGARIYAIQPSSDSIDFVFQLRDNATTNDRFVFHVDDYQGPAFDKYPLIIRGGTEFDLVNSALYVGGTLVLSNGRALQNITGNISMFTNDSGYLTAHPSVSAASSSNNSGRTYIQDILLDSFGHITGITTATETVVDTNYYTTGGTFNTSNGNLTYTRNDGGTYTVNLDGRYQASGSYLTSESDTLATVTARGASTSTAVTLSSSANHFQGHHYFDAYDNNGNHYPHYNSGGNNNGSKLNLRMFDSGGSTVVFYLNGATQEISWAGNTIWHSGNDGASSGLDADLLDGQHGSYYYPASNPSGYISSYLNHYTTGATFNTSNGVITFSRNDGNTYTVDIDGKYAESVHTHDDRYLPYAKTSDVNRAAGWYTIAANPGNRAVGRFILRDTSSGNHQSVVFYATHHYGNYSDITVLINSRYSGNPFRTLRIVDGSTYDGALLQVYIDDSSCQVQAWMLENIQNQGWVIKDWVADGVDPGDINNFPALTEVPAQVDLDQAPQGGIITTGPIYGGGDTTQYEYLNTNNYSTTTDTRYYTETEIGNFFGGSTAITGYNKTNWDTAFGWGNHSGQGYATTGYVQTQITNLIDSAPTALDTLNELAAALGDDANFATTITTSIGNKVSKSGDTMTGNLTFGTTSGLGVFWGMNTDAAFIRFVSTGNGAGLSYLEIGTQDDSDEPIWFTQSGNLRAYIATDGFFKNGSGYKYLYENGTWGINISGNAATVTDGVYTTGTYSNPAWITALAGSKITGNISGNASNITSYTINQNLGTTDSPTFNNVTATGVYGTNASSTRNKYNVYSNSGTYAIGMESGNNFGGLADWAMTFQMNNDDDRGFWWGDDGHNTSQGAMSLTTNGYLTVARGVRVGYGESDTTSPSVPLQVYGSGSLVFDVQGSLGQLFSVTDTLSGSLFSVNDISGLPVLEVFSDDRVVMGSFGMNSLVVSGTTTTVSGSFAVSGSATVNGGTVWHSNNDGSGSGLDADTLDGYHASSFLTGHPSVSAASSSNNSGRTYIQDILLDSFGHITGITTATETVVDTDTNYYLSSASFNTGNGTLTLGVTGYGNVTVNLDGRYQAAGSYLTSESDTLATVTTRGASTTNDITIGGLTVGGSLTRGSYTSSSNYVTGADNIVLKGNSSGVSGIFFESEKDGTNINHPSDFGFIQFHPYGIGGSSGESNRLVIGVSNDSDDYIVLNPSVSGGLVVRVGAGTTEYVVYHAGNIPTWNQNTTGNAATATYATSAGSATSASTAGYADEAKWISFPDGPRDLSDRRPNWNNRSVAWDFVNAGIANGSGNYGGVMTFSPWDGTTSSTGDSSYQLAFANTTGVNASGQPKLSIRNGIDTTWNSWYTLIHEGNISSYTSAHISVSAASSSNNSGRTYIQDILLDSYGHITGITTATETVVDTDTNYYVTSASFNTSNGVITLTRNDGGTVTVDIDGKYQEAGTYLGAINYNNDSNANYQLLWGSGNAVYGTGGVYVNPYIDYVYATSFNASDWFRSSSATGWYNSTYGGGIYQTESTMVRVYDNRGFWIDGGNTNTVQDATLYVTATNNNDWLAVFNAYNSSKSEYGVYVRIASGASYGYALMTDGSTWTYRVDGSGRVYAPIYYDINDTAYYLNPASTSNLATVKLNSTASGTEVFTVDGVNGRLFTITDDLSDSLFSVNTIAGVPVIEAFSDYRVIMGRYNQNDFYIATTGEIGMGNTSVSGYKLAVTGNIRATAFVKTGGSSSQFLMADGSVSTNPGWITSYTDTNYYLTSASFNTSNGILTLGVTGYGNVTVDLDGKYLDSSSYTASDVLSKLLTVDGSGSGLDADTLDGYHASSFLTSYSETDTLASVTARGSSTTAGITVNGNITVGNSTSSNIFMVDTDETTRRIHCNSSRIGFLNSSDNWSAYSDNTGNWITPYAMYASDWFRTYGTTGWYSETYAGGIHMTDGTWVRIYNNKQFLVENLIQSNTAVYAPIFYDSANNAYYLNPNGYSNLGTVRFNSSGANAEVVAVDGVNGRLFTVTDDMTDSIFSVNTISGLPVIEAFADYKVVMGRYGQNDFHLDNNGNIAMGSTPVSGVKLFVSGNLSIGGANSSYTLYNNGTSYFNGSVYVDDNLTIAGGYALKGNYGTWTGEENKIQWHSNNLYFQNTGGGEFIFRNSGGSNVFRITNAGVVYASSDINGAYILGTYFNASSGNSENPTIGQIWTQNTSDNYLRKSTPAHFISQLGLITTSNIGSQSVTYASTVGINYNNDSNSTYQVLWGSGNSVYGTGGVYVNPYYDYMYATAFVSDKFGLQDGTPMDCYMQITDNNPTEDGINYGAEFLFYGDQSTSSSHLYFGGALIYNNLVVNGRITENSSIRYKKDIVQIENGLEKVLQLSGVTYTKINNEQKEAGVIAEEVAKILPEAVGFDTEGRPDSVSYGRLTALLIEAIKDLKKEIDELKGNK